MSQTIAILGRQPALGMAELESLYGAGVLQPLGATAALLDVPHTEISFNRLGGTIKLARVLTILDTTEWIAIEKFLAGSVAEHAGYLPEGKMTLGLSTYGLHVKPQRINATGLALKKVIKATGRSVRIVPNKTPDLSSAQVLHNDLTSERAWELLCVSDGKQTHIAQTTNVQNINAYAARDQNRPKRDARVGMLPPKLAQIIINLAGTHTLSTTGRPPTKEQIAQGGSLGITKLLDPFCGTGVVPQEAMLMGYNAYGTDLEPRMIEYSQTNLEWLKTEFRVPAVDFELAQGDATNHQWESFNTIACETYLGRPFSALPRPEILSEVMQDVDTIHRKFLKNVARQTTSGFRMCIAVPAWKTPNGFKHLKVLDSLEDLGYTRAVFTHVQTKDLVYHRPEQIVARELVVVTRK